jgi:hypothetical protein
MKAPINFSTKLHGYELEVDGDSYILTTIASMDSSLWITPMRNSKGAIMLLFNWKREQYDIVPISRLSGKPDYPRSKQDLGFSPHKFKTFDSFIKCTKGLIRDHKELFN